MTEAQKKIFEDMTEEQKDFLSAVVEEMIRAEKRHKGWPKDAIHASAIINEEAGKLTQASIDYAFGNNTPHNPYERMTKKTISTAAMAMRFWHGMGTY